MVLRKAVVLLLTGGLAAAAPVWASCPGPSTDQPRSNFPSLNGRLLFQSWVPQGGGYQEGSPQIAYYDFATHQLVPIDTQTAAITNPLNPTFSPDGRWILFTGFQNNAWNVFIYAVGSTTGSNNPVKLTNSVSGSGSLGSEDPRFSLDGKRIVFKQGWDIKIADLLISNSNMPSFGPPQSLTQTAPASENSQPSLSPDGLTVYYTIGAKEKQQIHLKAATSSVNNSLFYGVPNVQSYYPVARSDGTVLFTSWLNSANHNDQIMMKASASSPAVQISFDTCLHDNSDPAPVNGTDYVFYAADDNGRYQLYLGDAATGRRWNLNLFGLNNGNSLAYLGPNYR